MPIARINNRLIFFAHIPKTGGSSVEAYMRQKGQVALVTRERAAWARSSAQHMEAAAFTAFFRDGFCDAGFAVVRDPKARLVSEYKMRRAQIEERLRKRGHRERTLRKVVKSLIGRRDPARDSVPEFDDWVRWVFANYRRHPYMNDNHIRPQVEFVHPRHRLFRFEDGLAPVLRWIDEVTDTPQGNIQVHLLKGAGGEVTCAPSTDALIRHFYRADYELMESVAVRRGAA